MHKKLVLIIALLAILIPILVLASNFGLEDAAKGTGIIDSPSATLPDLVGKIVGIALSFLGIIFFLLILVAGIYWMTAFGNSERVTKAKEIMEAAIIGLLIVITAYAVSKFVFQEVVGGGGSVNNGQTIQEGSEIACGTESNMIRTADGECRSRCDVYWGSQGGLCTSRTLCVPLDQYKVEEGYCPGDSNNICCVPNEAQPDTSQLPSSGGVDEDGYCCVGLDTLPGSTVSQCSSQGARWQSQSCAETYPGRIGDCCVGTETRFTERTSEDCDVISSPTGIIYRWSPDCSY